MRLVCNCAVHIEDCEGWWLFSGHSSVVENTGNSSQGPGFDSW